MVRRAGHLVCAFLAAAAVAAGGCGGEEKPNVRADDFGRACASAADCTIVRVGDVCDPCAGSRLGAISLSGKAGYDATVAAIDCTKHDYSGGPDGCPPPPSIRPACTGGTCATETARCGDGPCDAAWGGETALSCAADCSCGDGICDSSEAPGAAGECLQDCPL